MLKACQNVENLPFSYTLLDLNSSLYLPNQCTGDLWHVTEKKNTSSNFFRDRRRGKMSWSKVEFVNATDTYLNSSWNSSVQCSDPSHFWNLLANINFIKSRLFALIERFLFKYDLLGWNWILDCWQNILQEDDDNNHKYDIVLLIIFI